MGTINGCRVVALCSDPTVMGGAMGMDGCDVVVRAYERAMHDRVPISASGTRRRPAGRGRAVAARGRPDLPRDDPGLGKIPQISIVLGRGGRRGVWAGPHRPGDPGARRPNLRHRSGRGALGDRRGRGHAAYWAGPDTHGRRSGVVHWSPRTRRTPSRRVGSDDIAGQPGLDGDHRSAMSTSPPAAYVAGGPTTCTR